MKIKKINILSLVSGVVLSAGLVSCNKEDNDYARTVKPVVSLASTSFSVNEGTDFNITLKSDVVYKTKMDFKLEIISQSTDDHDYNFSKSPIQVNTIDASEGWGPTTNVFKISFPAFASEANITMSTILDDLAEGTEKIKFRITPAGNLIGSVNPQTQEFEVSINNKLKSSLDLNLYFDKDFVFSGTNYSLCGINYDVDFMVFDSANNQVNSDGQTGNCVEHVSMDLANYPNGTYTLVANLYDDKGISGAGISPAFDIPVKVEYKRGGSATLDGTYVQSGAGLLNSSSASGALSVVAKIVVNAGTFTIKKADDTVLAQGRNSQYEIYKRAFEKRRATK